MSGKGRKAARRARRARLRQQGRGAYRALGARVLNGRGGFWDDVKGFFRGAGKPLIGAAGKVLDNFVPGSGAIVSGISRLVGLGAYQPVRNNTILASPVPFMHSTIDDGVRIAHHEYLGNLSMSSNLVNTRFPINPGLPSVFPWLSQIAENFQEYQFMGLVFYFRSTSAEAVAGSSNYALGSVMGAVQYNVNDQPPVTQSEFLTLAGATDGKPGQDQLFPVECDPMKSVFRTHFVRRGLTGIADLAQYDVGVMNLATVGGQGAYPAGQVWVAYDVKLCKPQKGERNPVFELLNNDQADLTKTSGLTLGTMTQVTCNSLGVSYSPGDDTVLIPASMSGRYEMIAYGAYTQADAGLSVASRSLLSSEIAIVDGPADQGQNVTTMVTAYSGRAAASQQYVFDAGVQGGDTPIRLAYFHANSRVPVKMGVVIRPVAPNFRLPLSNAAVAVEAREAGAVVKHAMRSAPHRSPVLGGDEQEVCGCSERSAEAEPEVKPDTSQGVTGVSAPSGLGSGYSLPSPLAGPAERTLVQPQQRLTTDSPNATTCTRNFGPARR